MESMIRKYGLVVAAIVAGVSLFALVRPARGVDVITDQQIQAIRTNCTEIQGTLNRLQQSDLLLRTDRGELYRTIADKLMVPLNQRIASNQLDGGKLVDITADFNSKYKEFYNAYKEYDRALVAANEIDCVKQPTQFYDAVAVARDKRRVLGKANEALVALITDYKTEFKSFRGKLNKEGADNE
jgi:hypothetical protein